jgi:hypothetical protein
MIPNGINYIRMRGRLLRREGHNKWAVVAESDEREAKPRTEIKGTLTELRKILK